MADKLTSAVPHLQLGKPKYQQVIDQNAERLGSNPPDLEAVYDLLRLIAQDVHEIKVRLKRGV